jgi:hypothetical protein
MRRFTDDIAVDINALLISAGATTALELSPLLIDTLDSTVVDECIILSTAAALAQPTAIAWTPVAGAVYNDSVGGDGSFLLPDTALGTITTTATLGFTYKAVGFITFTDLAVSKVIEFSVMKNGGPVGFVSSLTGGGNGRPRTATFAALDLSNSPSDVYTFGIQTPAGIEAIDILSIALELVIQPTRNA